jgi:hypothetical protein
LDLRRKQCPVDCPNCRNVTGQRNLIRFVAEMRTAI